MAGFMCKEIWGMSRPWLVRGASIDEKNELHLTVVLVSFAAPSTPDISMRTRVNAKAHGRLAATATGLS